MTACLKYLPRLNQLNHRKISQRQQFLSVIEINEFVQTHCELSTQVRQRPPDHVIDRTNHSVYPNRRLCSGGRLSPSFKARLIWKLLRSSTSCDTLTALLPLPRAPFPRRLGVPDIQTCGDEWSSNEIVTTEMEWRLRAGCSYVPNLQLRRLQFHLRVTDRTGISQRELSTCIRDGERRGSAPYSARYVKGRASFPCCTRFAPKTLIMDLIVRCDWQTHVYGLLLDARKTVHKLRDRIAQK